MTRLLRRILNAPRRVRLRAVGRALLIFLTPIVVCEMAAAQDSSTACSQGPPTEAPRRQLVRRNYIEIVYNAATHGIQWIDREGIRHEGDQVNVAWNSVFAPVTFAKERIIVTICNAKFNSEPSTSVATTVIPESAPDIRGATAQNTATLLSTTVNALEATATKTAVAAPPAAKTADDYAQMAAAYHKKFQRLRTELYAIRCGPGPEPCAPPQPCAPPPPCIEGQPCVPRPACALDTIAAIQARADDLAARLPVPTVEQWPAGLYFSDQAAFDSFSAITKSLVDNINGLAATLAAGDYLSRATTLDGEYAALQAAARRTVRQVANAARAAAGRANGAYQRAMDTRATPEEQAIAKATAAAAEYVTRAANDLEMDPSDAETNIAAARTAVQITFKRLLAVQQSGHNGDEAETIARDLRGRARELLQSAQSEEPPPMADIDARLVRYLGAGINYRAILDSDQPGFLFQQTGWLTGEVAILHATASGIFNRMNAWREHSRVSLTSVVPPPGGNAVLNIRIILHEAYAPFAFGTPAKKDAGGDGSKTSSGTITAATATGSGPEQHEVRRVLVEVHRKADANLVGAIIGSTIPVRAYGVQPGPQMTAIVSGVSTTFVPYYAYESQNDHVQIQGMAGINWYPGGRDFYPGYLRGARRLIPGILFGTSVTAQGNFIGGLDFEPVNGFDIILGGEVGPVKQLAAGVTLGQTGTGGLYFASTDTVPTRQRLTGGFVFGIGFDLSVFSAVFSSGSAPSSTPAPTPAAH